MSRSNTATVAMIATGVCQVMTLTASRYTSPSNMATAPVSPMEPPIWPSSMSERERQSVTPYFSCSSRVAPVAPSAAAAKPPPATGHVVINAGNEMSRKTRPASAGLKILQPRPPKAILAMPMANTAPATTVHHGSDDGRLRASSRPVSAAEVLGSASRRPST